MNHRLLRPISVSVLLWCWTIGMTGQLLAQDVDAYRKANATALAPLSTAWVEFTIEESRGDPLPPADRSRVSAEAVRVAEINWASSHEKATVYLQMQPLAWKLITEDLRDIDRIATDEGFSPARSSTVDSSRTVLAVGDAKANLQPATRHLMIDTQSTGAEPPGSLAILRSPLRFGLIADRVFEDYTNRSITECSVDDKVLNCVAMESDKRRYELVIDPQVGHQYRDLRIYSSDGTLIHEGKARDYRLVDGIHYPHSYETWDFSNEGKLKRHRRLTVTKARFNHELPPDALAVKVPAATKVIVFDRPRPGEYVVREEQLVGPDELNHIIAQARTLGLGYTPGGEQLGTTNFPE